MVGIQIYFLSLSEPGASIQGTNAFKDFGGKTDAPYFIDRCDICG